MEPYLYTEYSTVIAALYLRGAPRSVDPPKRQWPRVVRALREEAPSLAQAANTLRKGGLWEAAVALEHKGLLSWAEETVHANGCLTVFDSSYPERWISVLGAGAPPALWRRGSMPSAPFAAVVGSRRPANEGRDFAFRAGRAIARGLSLVSGGAFGCDTAAESGCRAAGGHALLVVPQGLLREQRPYGPTLLSACHPAEPFSTANAMERNALIYAASERCLVAESRLGEGGTWQGATDALRRRLTNVFVGTRPRSDAGKALLALGAVGVSSPEEFLLAPVPCRAQGALFALC